MKQRIITAFFLAAALIPITVINHPIVFNIFQLAVFLLVIFATLEMINMFEKEKPIKLHLKIIIIILTILTYLNIGALVEPIKPQTMEGLELLTLNIHPVVIMGVVTITLLSLMIFNDDFNGSDVGKALTIIYYVGLGASSITLLRFLGVRFIVYVSLISVLTDVFAYFVGVKFGKHKMAPKISPKKSWEGAIGGTLIATVIASLFAINYGLIFPADGLLGNLLNPSGYNTIFDNFTSLGFEDLHVQGLIIIPITLIGSVASQIGDLVASKFKRNYNIKDFGNIFPGHGGVLDRFDSILFIGLIFLSIFIIITQFFPHI